MHQNIQVEAEDIQGGKLVVNNRFFFSSLKPFELFGRLIEDGVPVAKGGGTALSALPQGGEKVQLDYDYDFDVEKEYFLNVSLTDTREQLYADRGYIVAESQLALPYRPQQTKMGDGKNRVLVSERNGKLTLTGEGFVYRFDTESGQLSSIETNGKELLLSQPRPNFWHAPVDNDLEARNFQDSLSCSSALIITHRTIMTAPARRSESGTCIPTNYPRERAFSWKLTIATVELVVPTHGAHRHYSSIQFPGWITVTVMASGPIQPTDSCGRSPCYTGGVSCLFARAQLLQS